MRVETKQSIRDSLLDDLACLISNREFCSEMYEQTKRYEYLGLIETINLKITKRKQQLGEVFSGQFQLDQ